MEMQTIHEKIDNETNGALSDKNEKSAADDELCDKILTEKLLVLKPSGSVIKPSVTEDEVRKLLERLYGIVVLEMCELNAYDDRNYLIQHDWRVKNPILPSNKSRDGYVLKILNSLESKCESLIDGQIKAMQWLTEKKIKCSIPIKNISGKYFSMEKIGGKEHIVRLLDFLPGKIFHDIRAYHTKNLFYQVGKFIAQVDLAFNQFENETIKARKTIWMLDSVPQLMDFLEVVKNQTHKIMIEQIIHEFEKRVLSIADSLEKGYIHGDCNEFNLIVKRKDNQEKHEYEVCSIIDFGDVSYTCLIYELAVALTYMLLEAKDIEVGGLVIAGYSEIRKISKQERDILKLCVMARLCQSLVIGLYSASVNPENIEYVLTSQDKGWMVLEKLFNERDETILEIWESEAEKYLTQSSK
uniref:Hydroxylysine kinase n=1 Tax=Corethrella appendiculata TaxID=1370023 RepID=U5EXQ9_9DIPT